MVNAVEAENFKAEGNRAFGRGDYNTATTLYSSAINADPSNHYYYLNRSQANLKLGRWSLAEDDATKALELCPTTVKAFYRRGVARREQGNFRGAREDIKMFLDLGGSSRDVERELSRMPGYEIVNAGDKGLGVFALQTFHRGDLILTEAPLFSIGQRDIMDRPDSRAVAATVNRLPQEELRKYKSLKNSRPDIGLVLGVFATNSLRMSDDDSGIFLEVSRFNHSCSPNARYSWNPDIKRMRVYALRDISCGEEIFVSYISGRNVYGSTRGERQDRLKIYGFTCACTVCELQGPSAVASDKRRTKIKELWESVPHFPPNKTQSRLHAIVRAIHLLEEEGYSADYDDFTNDAAVICAFHSDWPSAKYWATKTYESRVAEFGEDSYRAKEVKGMYLDPKSDNMAGSGPRQKFDVRL